MCAPKSCAVQGRVSREKFSIFTLWGLQLPVDFRGIQLLLPLNQSLVSLGYAGASLPTSVLFKIKCYTNFMHLKINMHLLGFDGCEIH